MTLRRTNTICGARSPRIEPMAWNGMTIWQCYDYGTLVRSLSSKSNALKWLRTARAEMRRLRKMGIAA